MFCAKSGVAPVCGGRCKEGVLHILFLLTGGGVSRNGIFERQEGLRPFVHREGRDFILPETDPKEGKTTPQKYENGMKRVPDALCYVVIGSRVGTSPAHR